MLELAFFGYQIAHAPFFAVYGKLSPRMCAALSVRTVIMYLICLRFFIKILYYNFILCYYMCAQCAKAGHFCNQVSHVPFFLFYCRNSLKSVLLQV